MTLTKQLASRMTVLVMLGIAVAASGCDTTQPIKGTDSHHSVGNLGMKLTLPSGSVLNTVSYSITGGGLSSPITGSIDVHQVGATVSTAVGGIPAGNNYSITLTGTTTDGKTTCLGTNTFSIMAGQTTNVSVALQCRATTAGSGTANINGTINECPAVTAFSVAPLAQTVGGVINVSASASDPENSTLTFSWMDSAGAGSFASASSATTTFTCNLSGQTTLTVSADDGHGCSDSASIVVTCISQAVCGNGVTEPGEQCDDGNQSNTDMCVGPNCRTAKCGDGYVEAGVEACDDGNVVNGDGCENNCTVTPPPPGCGNGVVDPGEECDPGNGVHMSTASCAYPSCTSIICGNNRVDGSEVCDGTMGPSGPLGLGQVCNNCTSLVDNCLSCEVANCSDYLGAGVDLIAGCYHDPNPMNVQLCVDAINCARTQNCAYTSRGAEQCYCGTASSAQCQLGNGVNGACKTQFEAAAGSTSAQFVTGHFGDRSLPIGNAVFMLQCDRDFCNAKTAGGAPLQCVP